MANSTEFERIAWIKARLGADERDVAVGIGDDAAVLHPSDAAQAISVDTLVEGVHFEWSFATPQQLGRRALIAAVSDLVAMGAQPRAALVALIVPPLDDVTFQALIDGLAMAADETGARIVGGNLSAGSALSITSTVIGESRATMLTRAGARPGDSIFVTGVVGAQALGLACLQWGTDPSGDPAAQPFIQAWREPPTRVSLASALAACATAAIDVSDGLLQDLAHLCDASGVGAQLHAASLPHSAGYADLARQLERDPLQLALSGGGDYEILFTSSDVSAASAIGTHIGECVEGSVLRVLDKTGAELEVTRAGHIHFASLS